MPLLFNDHSGIVIGEDVAICKSPGAVGSDHHTTHPAVMHAARSHHRIASFFDSHTCPSVVEDLTFRNHPLTLPCKERSVQARIMNSASCDSRFGMWPGDDQTFSAIRRDVAILQER